jgi:hypothetical protein
MTAAPAYRAPREFVLKSALRFVRSNAFAVAALSALLLIPCFWHRHIQAGDLGSHIYNAWLAQLAERHEVTGLVVVRQWSNVLFDLLVLHVADLLGFVAAEKIAVSLAVLIFFWGSFSFIANLTTRPPWMVTPFLFVLAYGYAFHMGFMNYYLSVGMAFLALAAVWRSGGGNWTVAIALAALALVAHPIGFTLFVGVAIYIVIRRKLPDRALAVLLGAVAASFYALRLYFGWHPELDPSWRCESWLQLFGQDQIKVYGHRYELLSWLALGWGLFCAAAAVYDWLFRAAKPASALRLAVELYALTLIGTICLPENFRTSLYAGWVGLLVSRLTLVTSVFGLLGLSSLPLPRWSWRGALPLAVVFFILLYGDSGKLDRMETNARALTKTMAPGTRIVAVANAPEDWRVGFIYHSIDRACIGHCFSYANYEASSLQFRVRALAGNSVVTTSVDQSDDMSSGDYLIRKKDLPLISIYQCDDADFTVLCALPLREGQKTENPESDPGPLPDSESDSQEN